MESGRRLVTRSLRVRRLVMVLMKMEMKPWILLVQNQNKIPQRNRKQILHQIANLSDHFRKKCILIHSDRIGNGGKF